LPNFSKMQVVHLVELALGARRERRLGAAERVGVLGHQRVHLVVDAQLALVLGDHPIEHRLEPTHAGQP
jgi:hypothetical protein